LEDIWQARFAMAGGVEANAPKILIANGDAKERGNWIQASAKSDESFTVANSLDHSSETYQAER
jgi:hypothetical protein